MIPQSHCPQRVGIAYALALVCLSGTGARAEGPLAGPDDNIFLELVTPEAKDRRARILGAIYGNRRLNWGSDSDGAAISMQNRIQTRYVDPYDGDPRTLEELRENDAGPIFRRVRTILNGHLGNTDFTYHLQFDWGDLFNRDLAATYHLSNRMHIWLGRGKVLYNDERVTSSGRLQLINRSIVSDLFTVDRQQGLQVYGRLFAGEPLDMNYMVGAFTGKGIGTLDNDGEPMLAARVQFNLLGGLMSQAQSDIAFTYNPAASLAFAGMTTRSNCTVFTSEPESCKALPGLPDTDEAQSGQYSIDQAMIEGKFRWRGFSLMSEVHRKRVVDHLRARGEPGRQRTLTGAYLQGGLLPHSVWSAVPRQLEIAARYSYVDTDDFRGNDTQKELAGVISWFIDGHEHKLAIELARLTVADPASDLIDSRNRLRLQWELRF